MKNALKIQAVVDRFEDDNAILLIGEDEKRKHAREVIEKLLEVSASGETIDRLLYDG